MKTLLLPLLAGAALAAPQEPARTPVDLTKRVLERRIETGLDPRSAPPLEEHARLDPVRMQPDRVQPGLVRWHADEAAARRAAERSGKPVLVFQLLGELDEVFC